MYSDTWTEIRTFIGRHVDSAQTRHLVAVRDASRDDLYYSNARGSEMKSFLGV